MHQWEKRFTELLKRGKFGQDPVEFSLFLKFAAYYFLLKGIVNPLVVEIGVRRNRSKAFYKEILGASHISIDISDKYSTPDIVGDSHDPEVLHVFKSHIQEKNVDLLFIDGDHSFDGVRDDYFIYAPFVREGLVAVHDIACERKDVEVPLFWSNLIKSDQRYPYMTFYNHRDKDRMGIGLQVRD